MSSFNSPGTFRLVTVNTAPERAKRVIGHIVNELKDRFTIIHVDNCTEMQQVEAKVLEHQPDFLLCASMWTPEQSTEIQETAKRACPRIKTHALPYGLQVEKGPDAVIEYLMEQFPLLLDACTT